MPAPSRTAVDLPKGLDLPEKLRPKAILLGLVVALGSGSSPAHASNQGDGTRLELRGVLKMADRTTFSLHDPATGNSFWVPQGRTVAGVKTLDYDPETQTLTIRLRDRKHQLSLETPDAKAIDVVRSTPSDKSEATQEKRRPPRRRVRETENNPRQSDADPWRPDPQAWAEAGPATSEEIDAASADNAADTADASENASEAETKAEARANSDGRAGESSVQLGEPRDPVEATGAGPERRRPPRRKDSADEN